jgi:hypothetical protein
MLLMCHKRHSIVAQHSRIPTHKSHTGHFLYERTPERIGNACEDETTEEKGLRPTTVARTTLCVHYPR